MIELKNIAPISHNTGTFVNGYITCWIPLLLEVTIILCSAILVLTPDGQFLSCATIVFSEQYVGFSVWLVHIVDTLQCLVNQYFFCHTKYNTGTESSDDGAQRASKHT
jgi:hypothetical protein